MEKILINNGEREIYVTPKVYRVVFKGQGFLEGGLKHEDDKPVKKTRTRKPKVENTTEEGE